jgi:hypothetical protein
MRARQDEIGRRSWIVRGRRCWGRGLTHGWTVFEPCQLSAPALPFRIALPGAGLPWPKERCCAFGTNCTSHLCAVGLPIKSLMLDRMRKAFSFRIQLTAKIHLG